VNDRFDKGFTPIHVASLYGHTDVVAKLKQCGAEVESLTDDGVSPMHLACLRGHLAVVTLLVSLGAKVTVPDRLGNTPLHLAAAGKGVDVRLVEVLLEGGADPGVKNGADHTPLDRAVKHDNVAVVELLKRYMR